MVVMSSQGMDRKSAKGCYHVPLLLWPELFESASDGRPFDNGRYDRLSPVSEGDYAKELLELASGSAPWLIDHTVIITIFEVGAGARGFRRPSRTSGTSISWNGL